MVGLFFGNPSYSKSNKAVPRVAPKESSPSPTVKRDEGDFILEKRSDGTTVKYKKKTTYDFEGANIEGLYNKPSGSYISNIKDVKGKSIIRVRENFDAEVLDSSRLIK
jgi:hypothetical protein